MESIKSLSYSTDSGIAFDVRSILPRQTSRQGRIAEEEVTSYNIEDACNEYLENQ